MIDGHAANDIRLLQNELETAQPIYGIFGSYGWMNSE